MSGRAGSPVLVVAGALLLGLSGCGGSPSAPPTPQRTLIAQGSSDVPPLSQGVGFFVTAQITGTATLEATVDWTSASSQVAVFWGQGNCAQNPNCPVLVSDTTTAKPKTVTAANLPAGPYSLAVLNLATTSESVSYQIFLVR